jgi:hypothetical protein
VISSNLAALSPLPGLRVCCNITTDEKNIFFFKNAMRKKILLKNDVFRKTGKTTDEVMGK